jgi:hypothetical protein
MDYQEMDQEFARVVEMVFESNMRVEVIFEALKTIQEHPYSSPKLALEIGLNEWDK